MADFQTDHRDTCVCLGRGREGGIPPNPTEVMLRIGSPVRNLFMSALSPQNI